MATALTLLNNVLRGLRRDAVAAITTTDAYHLLLLQFLNRAKRDLEDKWDWQALRSTESLSLSASTQTVTVNINVRSRLLYRKPSHQGGWHESSMKTQGSQPQVFDTTDSTEYQLTEISWEKFEALRLTDDDDTQTRPQYFALRRTGTALEMAFWPMTTGTRTISARFVVPQADIPNTFMTNFTLSIPDAPVWTRALQYAIEDRGEGVGRRTEFLKDEADNAEYLATEPEMHPDDKTVMPL
jgi:hypothetical protein